MLRIGCMAIAWAFLSACAAPQSASGRPYAQGQGPLAAPTSMAQMRIRELEKDKQAYLKTAQETAVENERLKARVKELEDQTAHLKAENEELRARLVGAGKPPYSEETQLRRYGYSPRQNEPKPAFSPQLTGKPAEKTQPASRPASLPTGF